MEQMMEGKKMNWGTLVIGIVIGAIAMWGISMATKPAGGTVVGATYTGTITSINRAMQAGKIAGDVGSGASVQEYQFRIPEDLAAGYTPVVGDKVKFNVNPYQAQDVSDIRKAAEICSIRTFAAQYNTDGSVLLEWTTTATVSGFIRYTKPGGALIDIDVTSEVLSGTTIVPATELANANGYTLIVTCGPDSSNPGLIFNLNAKP